jgi:4-diphosphocytidyl-2-C-methyl-D-erythritol kinase
VFAAFSTERAARQVWERAPKDMRGFIAQGLEQHPLRDLARGSVN